MDHTGSRNKNKWITLDHTTKGKEIAPWVDVAEKWTPRRGGSVWGGTPAPPRSTLCRFPPIQRAHWLGARRLGKGERAEVRAARGERGGEDTAPTPPSPPPSLAHTRPPLVVPPSSHLPTHLSPPPPQVEEISAAGAHKKAAETTQDPLDKFCEGNPDADE